LLLLLLEQPETSAAAISIALATRVKECMRRY
jgi:hypothetical protein